MDAMGGARYWHSYWKGATESWKTIILSELWLVILQDRVCHFHNQLVGKCALVASTRVIIVLISRILVLTLVSVI